MKRVERFVKTMLQIRHVSLLTIFLFGLTPCRAQSVFKTDSTTIAFLSDTQAPLFFEWLTRKTNDNVKATKLIFADIEAKHPSSVFILGDVVSLGYSRRQWKRMDKYFANYKQSNISVYATLGNHELIFRPKKGEAQLQSRFPSYLNTGYATIVDSIAVILLNSNFNKMTALQIMEQDKWYAQRLNELNSDSAIKFIIVGCHHSPFTNSKAVKPDRLVLQKFVPNYLSCKKCVLFLSGHSHNFEHFNSQGKEFLVIGGGGGPQQPLHRNTIFTDLAASYKPMFHYLTLKRNGNLLTITSIALKDNFSKFENGLKFTISPK